MRCTIILRRIRPAAALPVQLANFTLWFLPLRWVLLEQRKRCPVCVCASHRTGRHWRAVADDLRMVWQRISVLRRGHGLLQSSEMPASYSAAPEWHGLDDSSSDLFSPATEVRQR